ncbi:MAG: precorrin-6A synthase (deacetylating) [Actinomycetota bacterium]|nr:precorrin-6A synthase (deacetylating) [Actinomycetota bacterium]
MTRRVLLVGIGAGDPDHLTLGAVRALERTDVVFLVDKGSVADELRAHRRVLLDDVLGGKPQPRVAERTLGAVRDRDRSAYGAGVAAWREERERAYLELIEGLGPDETGAFLLWGDPTLYDGTLAILDELRPRIDGGFEVEVVPGISSVSALAARHRVALNRIGEAVQFTTGRRLVDDGLPDDADNVVVLLDAHEAWRTLDDDLHIWWGAFVGMAHEVLVAGRLGDVRDQIAAVRTAAKDERGWMFDTYLLRRAPDPSP